MCVSAKTPSCTNKCHSYDESKTGNRCKRNNHCQCDGARRCSSARWCTGDSGSKASCPKPEADAYLVKGGHYCKSKDGADVKGFKNVRECAAFVKSKKGTFFTFGTGKNAGRCTVETTKSAACKEGFGRSQYDFYALGLSPVKAYKVKSGVQCRSKDKTMGKQKTWQDCAAQVEKNKGKFFVFGTGRKAGWCYMEKTSSAACKEGFKKDLYNFYALGLKPVKAYKVKSGVQCRSKDTKMGKKVKNWRDCAAKVKKNKGKFFVFGTGRKAGWCYIEKTRSAACKEGFKKDLYNFYALGKKPKAKKATVSCTSKCYSWDEGKTGNRCKSACDCDGARRCSGAGWCSGDSGSKSSCSKAATVSAQEDSGEEYEEEEDEEIKALREISEGAAGIMGTLIPLIIVCVLFVCCCIIAACVYRCVKATKKVVEEVAEAVEDVAEGKHSSSS